MRLRSLLGVDLRARLIRFSALDSVWFSNEAESSHQCGASRHFRLCALAMNAANQLEMPIANQRQTPTQIVNMERLCVTKLQVTWHAITPASPNYAELGSHAGTASATVSERYADSTAYRARRIGGTVGELLRFELEDGESVVVQMDRLGGGVVEATSASDVVARATSSFESALEGVRHAAASALRRMTELPQRPDEVTIEFGIQLDAEVGAVLARTGAQGHLQVQLTWHRKAQDVDGARCEDGAADSGTA